LSLYCLIERGEEEEEKGEKTALLFFLFFDGKNSTSTRKTHRLDLALVLDGQLVDDGRDHAARPAPGRPEVDEDGEVGLEDGLVPRRVGDGAGCLGGCGEEGRVVVRFFFCWWWANEREGGIMGERARAKREARASTSSPASFLAAAHACATTSAVHTCRRGRAPWARERERGARVCAARRTHGAPRGRHAASFLSLFSLKRRGRTAVLPGLPTRHASQGVVHTRAQLPVSVERGDGPV
jgi:hypothetical protein